MIKIGGQIFTEQILERIRHTIQQDEGLSRQRLSRLVCQWLDWFNLAGRPKEMSCRKALLELNRRGLIELPQARQCAFMRRAAAPPVPAAPAPAARATCELDELGALKLVRVEGDTKLSRLWIALMSEHHYLGAGPLCGAQARYLVHGERHGWLGGLSFSAAARRVEERDEWIGWNESARRRNLALLVNNSRFLIVPTVRVPNLASHVLALAQRRLGEDWLARYGYRPALLETYVERGRFRGICYQAANWRRVGVTRGRGRDGKGAPPKDVFVMPLERDWRERLCRLEDQTLGLRAAPKERAPGSWVENELGGAQLGDARLTARLLEISAMFYDKPTANIPQACGSAAAAKAAYRFLDNPNVQWTAILEPHYEATQRRLAQQDLVLVVQDTTLLNYTTHGAASGLGPIGTKSDNQRGLVLHDTLALTPQGVPLGLMNAQCWARQERIGVSEDRHQRPIEQKESFKWLESYRAVSQAQRELGPKTRLVVMGDREADIHELFVEQAEQRRGAQLLIRAERSRNRQALLDEDQEHEREQTEALWALLERTEPLGTHELLVPPGENRAARLARLQVRSRSLTLRSPKRKPHLRPVELWAVQAVEQGPPPGVEALEWMLLTTVEVKTKHDALERLEWYARRWTIEVYHRILKSGCRVEARQLESGARLRNCLAIDMIVAWRIHHLCALGRQAPDVPCTVYFSESEWKALTSFVHKTPVPPPTPPPLNEAVGLLGLLGGHLGRACDDPPGAEVLWRGMARLADIESAYTLYRTKEAENKTPQR